MLRQRDTVSVRDEETVIDVETLAQRELRGVFDGRLVWDPVLEERVEGLRSSDSDAEPVRAGDLLAAGDWLGDSDSVCESEKDRDPVADGDCVALGVPLVDGDADGERVPEDDCNADREKLAVANRDPLAFGERDSESVTLAVGHAESVAQSVVVTLSDGDNVAVRD